MARKKAKETTLAQALCSMQDAKEINGFLIEFLTPAEYQHLSARWQIVFWLARMEEDGLTQADIAERVGCSEHLVGRAKNQCVSRGKGVVLRVAKNDGR